MASDGKESELTKEVVSVVSSAVSAIGSVIGMVYSHLPHTHEKKPSYFMKCEESERYREMDSYTKDMILIAHSMASEKPFDKEMTKPFITESEYEKVLVANLGKYISKSDEDAKHTPIIGQISQHILEKYENDKSEFDKDQTEWDNASESRGWQTKVAPLCPVYIKYDELLSNESISKFAFSGLGCHYMKKINIDDMKENQNVHHSHTHSIPVDAVYIHDFSFLSVFKVREGYEKYGATAYFNDKYEIISIYNCETNKRVSVVNDDSDSDWNHAKWVYKTSAFAAVTIIDHLWRAHHTESQALYECNIECLPCAHPLRHFIKPFVYRTASINYLATQVLTNSRGYMERLWALPYTEIVRVFNSATMSYKFRTLLDFVDESMRDVDDKYFPLYKDSKQFWGVIRSYVEGFLKIYHKNTKELFSDPHIVSFKLNLEKHLGLETGNISTFDRFVEVLTQLICNGTGIHELVGQTSDYLQSADWIGTKLRAGFEISTVQTYGALCALSVMTGAEQPKIHCEPPWNYLFEDNDKEKHAQVITNYDAFRTNLNQLQTDIEKRNEGRKYPMQFFNPRHCKCSVSI